MSEVFHEVELDAPVAEGKKRMCFMAPFTWVQIYKNYHDDEMPPERRDGFYPLTLMLHRWDGVSGFPGGKMDAEDFNDPRRTVIREAAEEINHTVDYEGLRPLVSHESADRRIDCFYYDLGVCSSDQIQWILEDAAKSTQALSEGTLVVRHLCDYGGGRGWPNLRACNMLSTLVAEELDKLIAHLIANQPPGAIVAY